MSELHRSPSAGGESSQGDPLFDAYLDALLRGEVEEPEAFCSRHGAHDVALVARLEGVFQLLATAPQPEAPAAQELETEEGLPHERLGEYRLVRRLGEGGMGVVYLAQQEGLGRLAAVKVIRPELGASLTATARFEREARLVARLRHPNVVTVFGMGEQDGVRFFAMELVPGRSLLEVYRDAHGGGEPLDLRQLIRWGRDIALALAYAHGEGVIHRDVKPSNIRITPEGRALLLDFGLARSVSSASLTLTQGFAGSPAYAPPEQLRGQGEIDERADVYALGATLYEGATGRPPFDGDSLEAMIRRALVEEPEPPRRRRADVPRDLEVVLLHALEKDARRRYASAQSLADDLGAVLDLRPITARPAGPVERALRWTRRHRVGAAALGSAVVASLLAGLWLAGERRSARQEDEREARALVTRAEERLQEYDRRRLQYEQAELDGFELRAAQNERVLGPIEEDRLHEAERLVEEGRRERVLAFREAVEFLSQAQRLDADAPGLSAAWATYYYQEWLDVRDEPDGTLRNYYRARVESHDPDGTWSERVAGRALLQLDSEPTGAEVFLFRYTEIDDDDGRRVVPLPVRGGHVPQPAGEWALRVVDSGSGWTEGEHVIAVAGHPIRGTVLATRDRGEVRRLDRLVAVDGEPVADRWEAREAGAARTDGAPRRFTFSRAGSTFEVEALDLDALGVQLAPPRELVAAGGVPVTVVREGRLEELEGPAGIGSVPTAAPLFLSSRSSEGRTPLEAGLQDPGWYLAVYRLDGYETARVSFHIDHACESYSKPKALDAHLESRRSSPPGFVKIDIGANEWMAPEESFWLQRRETTNAEYLTFLNDPATRVRLAEADQNALLPRVPEGGSVGETWPTDEQGRLAVPPGLRPEHPVVGVSWFGAQAYAAWLDRQEWVRDGGWRAELPTFTERRWAAFGGDSRDFVHGETFSPRWVKSRFSRSEAALEPSFSFPVDESPWGVFDLAGSAAEWCADASGEQRILAGGSWARAEAESFLAQAYEWRPASEATQDSGFRVLLRRGAAGR